MLVGKFKHQFRRDVCEESRNVDQPSIEVELREASLQCRRIDAPSIWGIDGRQDEFVHGQKPIVGFSICLCEFVDTRRYRLLIS